MEGRKAGAYCSSDPCFNLRVEKPDAVSRCPLSQEGEGTRTVILNDMPCGGTYKALLLRFLRCGAQV